MTMWKDKDKAMNAHEKIKQATPGDDEDYDEFMERCMIDDDADTCQEVWDENKGGDDAVRHKTHTSTASGMEFVLSDETPDRMDDIIMSDGWDLSHFENNPIALFNHNSNFPIGKWHNLRVEDKSLRGHLELAPFGTSERIDEIRKLIDAGILRAVSVGFVPKEYKAREGTGWGQIFTKQELIETSLVSIPANPNALAVAKSLGVSRNTLDLVFAGQGRKTLTKKSEINGGQAKSTHKWRDTAMSLAQRVVEAEKRLVTLKDKLAAHFDAIDDSNVTDAQLEVSDDLNARIAQEEKGLDSLRTAERNLAATSNKSNGNGSSSKQVSVRTTDATYSPRPFSMPAAKKVDALEYLVRSGTIQLVAHQHKKNPEEMMNILAREYSQYADPATREFFNYTMKAAAAPAMTSVVGWAAELVQTVFSDFMETLMPKSVFPRLSGAGLSLSFGRAGKISIPTRSRTPTIAGSFVGEGLPIPVRQGAFTAQILTPKKMAVITTWTREIDEHSIPAIEGLLRSAIQEDTAISLDSVLLDANAATVVRPAGILQGVAAIPATAIGTPPNAFNAIVTDLKNITGALMTSTQGHIRNMVFLMNPQQMLSASLISAPGVGAFPFQAEIAQGRLLGYGIIDSGTVPLGTVIALDAADFVTAGGDAPRFEISDQATLHMEDTAPGEPITTPVRSLFQTDSLALRLILPVNWTLRRPGMVAWVQGVTW
jgi:HK97 family phage prohead protease/HK97 family phage major capsid protein